MAKYKVICIGYAEPNREEVENLIRFEADWLERNKKGHKILIHPGLCFTQTEVYNDLIIIELMGAGYTAYNLSGADLGTKYDFNKRTEFTITI